MEQTNTRKAGTYWMLVPESSGLVRSTAWVAARYIETMDSWLMPGCPFLIPTEALKMLHISDTPIPEPDMVIGADGQINYIG